MLTDFQVLGLIPAPLYWEQNIPISVTAIVDVLIAAPAY